MDALCSQCSSLKNCVIPQLFAGFSGTMQLGYATSLPPKNLAFVRIDSNEESQCTMAWQLLDTDSDVADMKLFEFALDINFVVCTRGYPNSTARREAAKVFVKRNFAKIDVSSNKAFILGLEVNVKHKTLSSMQQRDISIIAWLRQTSIPDVSIVPLMSGSQRPKESEIVIVEISDREIELVNEEVVALFSLSKFERIRSTDLTKVLYNTACIVYSFSDEEMFSHLRDDVLHVFPNPDVMFNAIEKMKELSLQNVSSRDALLSLPLPS